MIYIDFSISLDIIQLQKGVEVMSFGSRLKERREALQLKQSELGKLLGVTGSAIGNYENGVSSPKADILYKVFDVLQCDANYLFQDDISQNEKNASAQKGEALIRLFDQLNEEGQEQLLDYADTLVTSGKFTKKTDTGKLASEA